MREGRWATSKVAQNHLKHIFISLKSDKAKRPVLVWGAGTKIQSYLKYISAWIFLESGKMLSSHGGNRAMGDQKPKLLKSPIFEWGDMNSMFK